MAARARALTEIDAADWALFARKIAPLPGRRTVPPADAAPAAAFAEPRQRAVEPAARPAASPSSLLVGGQPAGVDSATWRRFHRGKLGSARKLDLHGMTAQAAFHALRSFLRTAHADRLRCVEIVTGKGGGETGGVIRREFPLWLNQPDIRPMVLAAVHPHATSAMQSHATNPGSVRLLLRRPRA